MPQKPREKTVTESTYQMTHYIVEDRDREKDTWICYLEVNFV